MDFVSDQLFDGRPIRILTVLDVHTREALSVVPRMSFRAFDVVAELSRLVQQRGRPKTLKVDNVLYREALGHVGPQISSASLN
jgi:putative transposase